MKPYSFRKMLNMENLLLTSVEKDDTIDYGLSIKDDPINGNDLEKDEIDMPFTRNNKNIIGYMLIKANEKSILLGDIAGGQQKSWYPSDGECGQGMYFFEYNFKHALAYAKSCNLDIIGAVINPKNTLDFTVNAINIISKHQNQFDDYCKEQIIKLNYILENSKTKKGTKYESALFSYNRLKDNKLLFDDYFEFLNTYNNDTKNKKIDSFRYIKYANDLFFKINLYQSTVLCIKNKDLVTEYFNPLRSESRDYIEKKYFSNAKKEK